MENNNSDENIKVIKRQTNYSEDVIREKLIEHNNNIENILREYLGILNKKQDENSSSTNQLIFKGIREFMN